MNQQDCRELVLLRSGGLCERCGRRGHTFHHRKNRSAGGKWDCANIVYLCGDGTRGCHGWVTTHPKDAGEEGYHIPSWQEPQQIPVLIHRRNWRHLTCDTSAYDITQTTVDVDPHNSFRSDDDGTSPDHGDWDADW